MFNCAGCWESPCVCGKEYEDRSPEWLENQIRMLQKILDKKEPQKPDSINDGEYKIYRREPSGSDTQKTGDKNNG